MPIVVAMPKDKNSSPIPILSYTRGSGTHKITTSGTSARNATPFVTTVVSIFATEDCYIEIGDNTVVATTSRHFIPKGIYLDIDLSDGNAVGTYIAAIQSTAGGTLHISERA